MNISKAFEEFCSNLVIKNQAEISQRYKRITRTLNSKYYSSDSDTKNSLQVGSYGRDTAINGASDVDMIYILPPEEYSRFNSYQSNGQSALLQEVKNEILKTYPDTDISGDGQVVVVSLKNQTFEVVPSFEQSDNSFKYPDSNDGGSWRLTNPRPEISEINRLNLERGKNLKPLCRMARAWKNTQGVAIGGLLIDTLAYNFLLQNSSHSTTTYSGYHFLVRDFFKYLSEQNKDQVYWFAPGSNQHVYPRGNFVAKAKKAYEKILDAIEKNSNDTVYLLWKGVFGKNFPDTRQITNEAALPASAFRNTEEFIEDQFNIDIRYPLLIDCEVSQDGFMKKLLRDFLSQHIPLLQNRRLRFFIKLNGTPGKYSVKWKVQNVGPVAEQRNCIRGQIINDEGRGERKESTSFYGPHFVECYIT